MAPPHSGAAARARPARLREVAALGRGDAAQRVGGVGEAEMLAHLGRAALGHEGLGVAGLRAQLGGGACATTGGTASRSAISMAGSNSCSNGSLPRQRGPARHHARHRDRVPAARLHRQFGPTPCLRLSTFQAAGATPEIQSHAAAGRPDDGETVAPTAGLGSRWRPRGGRVHGVAASSIAQSGLRRGRWTRCGRTAECGRRIGLLQSKAFMSRVSADGIRYVEPDDITLGI